MNASNDTDANVALLKRGFGLLATEDLDAFAELITADFIINLQGAPYQMRGRDAWKSNVAYMRQSFPDITADIEDIFGSGDRVAVRLTFRGTHRGEFQGIPATGRRVAFGSIELYRCAHGKIAEEWIASDIPSLMAQIGGTPSV